MRNESRVSWIVGPESMLRLGAIRPFLDPHPDAWTGLLAWPVPATAAAVLAFGLAPAVYPLDLITLRDSEGTSGSLGLQSAHGLDGTGACCCRLPGPCIR